MAIESETHDTLPVPRDEGSVNDGPSNFGYDSTSKPKEVPCGSDPGMSQLSQLDGGQPVDQPVDPSRVEPHKEADAGSQPEPSKASQSLFLEIRALKHRLHQLEEQEASELNAEPEGARLERQTQTGDDFEDKKLRKQIRRPRRSKEWVEKHEGHADLMTSDRNTRRINEPLIYITTREDLVSRYKDQPSKMPKSERLVEWERPRREEESMTESLRRWTADNTLDGQQDSRSLDYVADNETGPEQLTEISALLVSQSLEWNMFRSARNIPTTSSHPIYILMGEPKIWNDTFTYSLGYKPRISVGGKPHSNSIATAKADPSAANRNTQEKQAASHAPRQDGQAPLPERIRIHSKQLIKTLSVVRGSELIALDDVNRNYSVVMLRPYRMLTYYKDEIRDRYKKLLAELEATNSAVDSNEPSEKPAPTVTEANPGEFPH